MHNQVNSVQDCPEHLLEPRQPSFLCVNQPAASTATKLQVARGDYYTAALGHAANTERSSVRYLFVVAEITVALVALLEHPPFLHHFIIPFIV